MYNSNEQFNKEATDEMKRELLNMSRKYIYKPNLPRIREAASYEFSEKLSLWYQQGLLKNLYSVEIVGEGNSTRAIWDTKINNDIYVVENIEVKISIGGKRMKLFFDFEFTGLHKGTTPISLGIVSEDNHSFYAEFKDCDNRQVDRWIEDNVISNLLYGNDSEVYMAYNPIMNYEVATWKEINMKSTKENIAKELKKWISQFDNVEMWGDCMAYDWVLFCDLFGHAFSVPKNVYYIPMDICTLFYAKGIDPDISRREFTGVSMEDSGLHNSLYDARLIKKCYEKLSKTIH